MLEKVQKDLKSISNNQVEELLSRKVAKQQDPLEAMSVFQSIESFLNEMKNERMNTDKTKIEDVENADIHNDLKNVI